MNTHTSPPVFLEKLVPPRLRRREKAAPVVCRNGDVPEMRVLSVTSEIFPLVKTGGLADVTGSLPKALEPFGVETTSLIPGYPQVMKRLASADPAPKRVATIEDLLGTHAVILEARIDGLNLLVLDAPELFHRPGGPYVDPEGTDHPDNWRRFAALSKAAAEIAGGLIPAGAPISSIPMTGSRPSPRSICARWASACRASSPSTISLSRASTAPISCR